VIRIFALSRVYYVASIIPLTTAMVKKFETLIGKFIWNFSGKILRVSIDDMKNHRLSGGMQLPCLANMANSLMASQCVRALRSGNSKTILHLEYWLGDLIGTLSPDFSEGTVIQNTPAYFEHLGLLLADLMASGLLDISTLLSLNNRTIYRNFISSLPLPKVVRESETDYGRAWKRLQSKVIEGQTRDTLFLLLHNKLPVPERLFRINILRDPYCLKCLGAEISDLEHFFCSCSQVHELWLWLRSKLANMDVRFSGLPDWDILNLCYHSTTYDQEVTWLLANYVQFVWDRTYVRERNKRLDTFFGFLKFKYREILGSLVLRKLDEFG